MTGVQTCALPILRALGTRLSFTGDASMRVDAARVRIAYEDGHVIESRIDAARGSLDNPLSDVQLEAKLRDLCRYGGSGVDDERLLAALWSLPGSGDAAAAVRQTSLSGNSNPRPDSHN